VADSKDLVTEVSIREVIRRLAPDVTGPLARLAGGQTNAAYAIGDVVVRINCDLAQPDRLAREATVLASLARVSPVPRVLGYAATPAIGVVEALATTRLDGVKLSHVWPTAPIADRQSYLVDLTRLLSAIHAVRPSGFGQIIQTSGADLCAPGATWKDVWLVSFTEALAEARSANVVAGGADRALLDEVEQLAWTNVAKLQIANPCLVHNDVHFGNVLVGRDPRTGRPVVTGLLDFERSLSAPIDYELDILARFFCWPKLFVEEEWEERVDRDDFRAVLPALRQLHPAMFDVPHLADRLALYALAYDLRHFGRAIALGWVTALPTIRGRIKATLSGHYHRLLARS
jgi:aminoglycoside phosphotransferase (APT) family kinase protein